MQRISVVGTSGAGKFTFAGGLAERLGVPIVELDAIFHQPDWTPLDDDEFTRRVAAPTGGDGWVVDGCGTAWQRIKNRDYRAFAHRPSSMFEVLESAGLRPYAQARRGIWQVCALGRVEVLEPSS